MDGRSDIVDRHATTELAINSNQEQVPCQHFQQSMKEEASPASQLS